MPDPAHQERERFFGAAKLVAALTMLSRLLGMVRDMAIVALGATRATDSFWTAFSIPNLFRRLFGEGAMSAAFVPVFTEVAETEGWDRARLVLANAAGLLAVILAAVVVAAELVLAGLWAADPGDADRALLLKLAMIMLPFMFTICLLALGSAALNCRGHFAYPALAPALLNVCLIAAAFAAHRFLTGREGWQLGVLAGAVVVAGAVQLAGVIWLLRRAKLAAAPRLRPLLAPVRRIARLVVPTMVPLGVLQFSAFFSRIYAWWMTATPEAPQVHVLGFAINRPLSPGVVTCLYAGVRLYMFPLGILAISLATAVFPLLSRYAARRDIAGLRDTTNRALRLSLFLGLPAGVALILLAEPSIALIYRHGRFDDVARAAAILRMYSLGMWAYFAHHILLRAFFAQKDTATPMKVSCSLAAVDMLLVATLIFTPLGAAAIGLSTALTASTTVLLLAWVLHRRWGRLGLRGILLSLARTAGATAAMAGAILLAWWAVAAPAQRLARAAGRRWIEPGAVAVVCIVAGAAAYLGAAALLRSPELRALRRRREDTGRAGGTYNGTSDGREPDNKG